MRYKFIPYAEEAARTARRRSRRSFPRLHGPWLNDFGRKLAKTLKALTLTVTSVEMTTVKQQGSHTLYVNNLSEKISKQGKSNTHSARCPRTSKLCNEVHSWIERAYVITVANNRNIELRMALYSVLSSLGKILDIVAARTYRLRGQAWIVYDTMDEAQRAFEGLQNFPFYDKPLVRL